MGMCKPSGGITKIYGPYGKNNKDIEGCPPNSRTDYYDKETEKLLQQRWYDNDGKAIWDRDWDHNDSTHTHPFPHDHFWEWTKNNIHPPRPEYKGPNDEKINKHYC